MQYFEQVDKLIQRALQEDIGTGDITTLSTIPEEKRIRGLFLAKESGVICGLPVVERVFAHIDPEIRLHCRKKDGDTVARGDAFAEVSGPARGILTGERVALHFLQRLSGIATRTRICAEAVKGTGARITDTGRRRPGSAFWKSMPR
jgi:nicotinate-nucleotide pyrophosphorylase (carboxylating)